LDKIDCYFSDLLAILYPFLFLVLQTHTSPYTQVTRRQKKWGQALRYAQMRITQGLTPFFS